MMDFDVLFINLIVEDALCAVNIRIKVKGKFGVAGVAHDELIRTGRKIEQINMGWGVGGEMHRLLLVCRIRAFLPCLELKM